MEFSQEQIKAVLESKEGRRLLELMQADGGKALSQAAAAWQSGDQEAVKSLLQPITQSPEAAQLLRKIDQRHG